jgi:hypothetical protein
MFLKLQIEHVKSWGVEKKKPMRMLAQLYSMFCRLSLAQPKPQNKARIRCRAVAFPKMFI